MKMFLPIALLFLIACGESGNKGEKKEAFTKERRIQVEQECRQMLQDYFKAVQTKGLTGEFDFLDNSTDFYWIPPGHKKAIDYDSVVRILEGRAPAFISVTNYFDSLRIRAFTNDTAKYSGYVISTIKDTSGAQARYKLWEEGVLIRRKDGWKLLQGKTVLDRVLSEYK